MVNLLLDMRVALRSLRRSPAFALTSIATLALGIGLTTAIFSLVRETLLRPLPFEHADRLVQVWETQSARGVEHNVVNPGNFLGWEESATSFESLSAVATWSANLSDEGAAERVPIAYATPRFLDTLGAKVRLGRGFAPSDAADGANEVAVLSEKLWRTRYAADPRILGRDLSINGTPTTVIGVLDASADFPVGTALWMPMSFDERARAFRGRYLQVLGRLAPEVTLATARAEMRGIAARLEAERPDFNAGWSAAVVPLDEELVGDYRRALWTLLAATSTILLLACANLSGLLLARNASRRHDLAVRGALGAGRGRLARHLLVESLVLAFAGGALALAVAQTALTGLGRVLPVGLPAHIRPGLDAQVLAFAAVASLACMMLFGLAPALAATRARLRTPLLEGGPRTVGRRSQRARRTLVVAEVALSMALVAGASLLARSLSSLHGVNPGFRVDELVTARVDLAGASYREEAGQVAFFDRLERRLAAAPGVDAAGAISWLPLAGRGAATSYRALDRPPAPPGGESYADVRVVTPGFFRAAGVHLVAGRLLDARDDAAAPAAVVISEFAARQLWPGQDPIGRELAMSWGEERSARVVGVISDLHLTTLDTDPRGALFWSMPQLPNSFMSIVVRSGGSPAEIAATIRAAVAEIDPTIPAAALQSMDEVISAGTQRQRFTTTLLALFATLGLALSAIGLYGLLASAVAERRREIGVRMALGADVRRTLREIGGGAVRTVSLGILAGAPLVLLVGRLVASLLYGVSPVDPWTLLATPAVLLTVAVLACAVPAWRAAHVHPAEALHEN